MYFRKRRRYHSPDRRPVVGVQLDLEWDGCTICGEMHVIGQGVYCSIDGRHPIAFVMLDDDSDPHTDSPSGPSA